MKSESSGTYDKWKSILYTSYHAQHFQFIVGVKSISALYLEGGCSFRKYLTDTDHALLEKIVFGGVVKNIGRVQNTAAAPGDFLVSEPCELVEELAFAAPRVDKMCVGIAEGRHYQTSLGVDELRVCWRLSGAQIGNHAILNLNPRVV